MILLIVYSLFLVLAAILWVSVRTPTPPQSDEKVTAIVVTRNEEANIRELLTSLRDQTHQELEIIMVDDHSTDQTVEFARNMELSNLTILSLTEEERGSAPKKAGLVKAVEAAEGSIIFTTDGDCTVPPQTIGFYAGLFNNEKVQMVAGPVAFKPKSGIWHKLQTVEFASLIGSAAVAFFMNRPIMCSAANLAYRKSAFLEAGGYKDNLHRASGDDEFLMNKIQQLYPSGIQFAKNRQCIVSTTGCDTPLQFFHQRKRWAGKWRSGTNMHAQVTAVLIFAVNAITLGYAALGHWEILALRCLTEALFLTFVLFFLQRLDAIPFIPLTQLVYPFYAVFFGIVSLVPSTYLWKERRLR